MKGGRFVSRISGAPHWVESPLFGEALPYLEVVLGHVHLRWEKMGIRLAQRMVNLEAPCAACLRKFPVVMTTPTVARAVVGWATDPPRSVVLTVHCSQVHNAKCFEMALRGVHLQLVQSAHAELVKEVAFFKPSAPSRQLSLFARR